MFKSVQTIPLSSVIRKPIEFYLKDFLPMPQNTVGMIASKGGMGKTFLAIRVSAEFIKETNQNVLVWFSEDEPEMIAYRFDKLVEQRVVNQETQNKIHYITTPPLQFASKVQGVFKANYEAVSELRKDCINNNIKLLVIDPLLAFYGGQENDNSEARVFMQVFLQWAKEDKINILFIHHGKKESGEVRGASAFVDATRFVYELHYPMDGKNIDFDKKDLGIREIRLTKDNHNVYYHFNKIFENGIGEMKILPNSTDVKIQYQDKNGYSTPAPTYETTYEMPTIKEDFNSNPTLRISYVFAKDDYQATKGFKRVDVNFTDLLDFISQNNIHYSATEWNDGYRSGDNYISGEDMIVFDIDDGMTVKQAKQIFSDYNALIVTTKSHQKDKSGLVCDRFRVIIPYDKPLDNIDKEMIKEVKKLIYIDFKADEQTANLASKFRGASMDAVFHFTNGDTNFSWDKYYQIAKIDAEKKRYEKESARLAGNDFSDLGNDDKVKALQSRFNNLYGDGTRNSTVADVLMFGKSMDMNFNTIETIVEGMVSASGNPLGDKEMTQLFRYHLK